MECGCGAPARPLCGLFASQTKQLHPFHTLTEAGRDLSLDCNEHKAQLSTWHMHSNWTCDDSLSWSISLDFEFFRMKVQVPHKLFQLYGMNVLWWKDLKGIIEFPCPCHEHVCRQDLATVSKLRMLNLQLNPFLMEILVEFCLGLKNTRDTAFWSGMLRGWFPKSYSLPLQVTSWTIRCLIKKMYGGCDNASMQSLCEHPLLNPQYHHQCHDFFYQAMGDSVY